MDINTRRNMLIALAFLAGCAVSRVQWVPPALAQAETGVQRWDYYCTQAYLLSGPNLEDLHEQLKAAGQQGWELVTVSADRIYCFKRPLR